MWHGTRHVAKTAATLLASFALAGCLPNSIDECNRLSEPPSGRLTCQVPDWVDRSFDLYVPATWDGIHKLPLIVALHGGAGNRSIGGTVSCPNGALDSAGCLQRLAMARGYVVAIPDGTGARPLRGIRTWNAGGVGDGNNCTSGSACREGIDDVAFFADLLHAVDQTVPIDASHVFATGLSNGGAMSHRLACEAEIRLAGIAPVAGANQHADTGGDCQRATAILHTHGTADPNWLYEGGVGGVDQGRKTSVAATMEGWRQRNGCSVNFTDSSLPDTSPDGLNSVRRTWSGCASDTELIIVNGGGHTWPGGAPSRNGDNENRGPVTYDFGSEVMLDFFDAHR
jgi:polyhydroxybutyrate depolymerase